MVVDVRKPEELFGPLGRIAGAINIPIRELEGRIDELVPFKDCEIAVICQAGVRSRQGTALLCRFGFNAVNVAGGMEVFNREQ